MFHSLLLVSWNICGVKSNSRALGGRGYWIWWESPGTYFRAADPLKAVSILRFQRRWRRWRRHGQTPENPAVGSFPKPSCHYVCWLCCHFSSVVAWVEKTNQKAEWLTDHRVNREVFALLSYLCWWCFVPTRSPGGLLISRGSLHTLILDEIPLPPIEWRSLERQTSDPVVVRASAGFMMSSGRCVRKLQGKCGGLKQLRERLPSAS